MKNLFNSIQLSRPKSNLFDLTHDVKLSTQFGDLTPILALECVPGDKFNLSCESLVRFAPLIAPVMHRMNVTMHYFFVPNRIVWDNWEKFITDANSGIQFPFINYGDGTSALYGKFVDYMGVPPVPAGGSPVQLNAIPFAAYQAIYNEYYRDQNLEAEVNYKLIDGSNNGNNANLLVLRNRAFQHDYFTACLPFAQKGSAVDIPLGTIELSDSPNAGQFKEADIHTSVSGAVTSDTGNLEVDGLPSVYDPNGTLEVQPTTINQLRWAFRLQEWLEKNARGGTRYIENILTHFGIKSSDARLQRPEYITGVKSPVVISEVLNTTGEDGGLPQGNMAGHAISVNSGNAGSYRCEEHGYIIGIMSVMPETAYQQGVPRTYLKNDTLDFFWPTFANIGEQAVTVDEIFAYTGNGTDTFGYLPRYSEYKYMPSRVAGDFRTSLDYWHLGRIFDSEPALNTEFIQCDHTEFDRIFAVTDPNADKLYCHVLNKITAIRPMPKYGTPMF